VAILDPQLTRTQPRGVAAAAGIDAVAHALETAGCKARTSGSRRLSVAAWQRLSRAFPRALCDPADDAARADMLLGAHLAGAAIECSMLGAAHACANPLTARFGTTHGVAVGVMLPHVVRFNAGGRAAPVAERRADSPPETHAHPYADLADSAESLAVIVENLLEAAGLPRRLRALGVAESDLEGLAHGAAQQWTAAFNPRPVGAEELRQVYRAALDP
jgi:alcohol dehydrogenase